MPLRNPGAFATMAFQLSREKDKAVPDGRRVSLVAKSRLRNLPTQSGKTLLDPRYPGLTVREIRRTLTEFEYAPEEQGEATSLEFHRGRSGQNLCTLSALD